MRAFEPVEQGWQSRLETWEREYLAGLLEQVGAVLAAEGPLEHSRPGTATLRARESESDGEVLAALDFDAAPGPGGPNGPGDDAPAPRVSADVATLLEVLLPEASEDPEVAVEVSTMNRQRLRALKHSRLREAVCELLEPTGAEGAVLVRRGHEGQWLAAVNDVRLVLAHRLGIDGPDSAQEVHDLAWGPAPDDEGDEARWRRGLAMSYDMLTWWQESLLTVLLAGEGPA